MNGYEGNEWNCKEEVFGVYNAFTTLFFDMKEVLVNIHCILNIIILIFRQESNTTFLFESSYRSSIPSERWIIFYLIENSLAIVKSRVLRSKQFDSNTEVPPLVAIESLLGIQTDSSFVSLLGVLSRNPSNLNEFFLEDQPGRILLDLTQTVHFWYHSND